MIHGARAIITKLSVEEQGKQASWLRTLVKQRGYQKVYVALANKNARIAWALMQGNTSYQSQQAYVVK